MNKGAFISEHAIDSQSQSSRHDLLPPSAIHCTVSYMDGRALVEGRPFIFRLYDYFQQLSIAISKYKEAYRMFLDYNKPSIIYPYILFI